MLTLRSLMPTILLPVISNTFMTLAWYGHDLAGGAAELADRTRGVLLSGIFSADQLKIIQGCTR